LITPLIFLQRSSPTFAMTPLIPRKTAALFTVAGFDSDIASSCPRCESAEISSEIDKQKKANLFKN